MSDLLQVEEHRVADGTRPLEVGKSRPALQPSLLELNARTVTCFSVTFAAATGTEPHPSCRRVVQPGEHYLLFIEHDAAGNPLPQHTHTYCASCAVRECHWWQVSEASS